MPSPLEMDSDRRKGFTCDQCGRRFAWKPAYAGRQLKCGCGHVISVAAPEVAEAEPEGSYALAADDPVVDAQPAAVVAATAVLEYRRPAVQPMHRAEEAFAEDGPLWKHRYLPMALAAGSLLVFAWQDHAINGGDLFALLKHLCVFVIYNAAILLVAVLIGARLIDNSFGILANAVPKLAAIALGPALVTSLATALAYHLVGPAFPMLAMWPERVGWIASVPFYAWFFWVLFDFDFSEIAILIFVIVILKAVTAVVPLIFQTH